jgi:hypothetical protein
MMGNVQKVNNYEGNLGFHIHETINFFIESMNIFHFLCEYRNSLTRFCHASSMFN